jgi:hypothetical protein
MSLLTLPDKPTLAQARAVRVLALPRLMFNRLLRSWSEGLDAVWSAPNPADVLAALGPQAGELFTRSEQLRAFLESQQPGSTAIPSTARIKPYAIHPDGTVTLQPAAPAGVPAT